MSFTHKVAEWFGVRSSGPTHHRSEGIIPPARSLSLSVVTADRALTLSTVFRAVQVLGTAVSQLSVKVQRSGTVIEAPTLIKKPNTTMTRRAFIEIAVISLALSGNCFWRLVRAGGPAGSVIDIEILNSNEVRIESDVERGTLAYWHRGTKYPAADIKHLKYLPIPGKLRGLGPIQAAGTELRGSIEARDYASNWFSESDEPTGFLYSDQDLTAEKAKKYRDAFTRKGEFAPAEGEDGRTIRVMGAGLKYDPMVLKPADVQFLESQQFSTTQIARLFGLQSSMMLAAVEGGSQTYQNVEQEWIGFNRFTLMKYIGEIEDAFTDLLPYGQRVKFNVDALLRSDTKTRYEAHNLALTGKWKTADEVRADEDMPALTDDQKTDIAANAPKPAVKDSTNAA